MKNNIRHIILCILALSIMGGCVKFRYINALDSIDINVDWSGLGEQPNGVSVIFYPKLNFDPIVTQTNDIYTPSITVMEGMYDVLIFNNTPAEFGTLNFSGMDKLETFEISSVKTESKWYKTKYEEEFLAREPEDFAAATSLDFEVTKDMIEASLNAKYGPTKYPGRSPVLSVRPENVIIGGLIKVKISGIHNAKNARGSISGMARSYKVASASTGTDEVTYLLEGWSLVKDEGSYKEGKLKIDFSTLGLPNLTEDRTIVNKCVFKLSILLVDNKTQVEIERDVTKQIENALNNNLPLEIKIGYTDEDKITLPTVKPEGGSEGGFDPDVDGWGEEEIIDIPL